MKLHFLQTTEIQDFWQTITSKNQIWPKLNRLINHNLMLLLQEETMSKSENL